MITKLMTLAFVWLPALAAVDDPRTAKPEVAKCVEVAKEYLRSGEYDDQDEELAVIAACRDVESDCLRAVGENLSSSERAYASTFLPVIKSCRGPGMGACYRQATSRMISFDYREAAQAQAILKKCE
jgi:hypothetical protein